jgi:hypothetical protein
MTLNDQIIDEAEMLAEITQGYLPADQIADAVSDAVGVKLAPNSIGYRLAEAAYNRIWFAASQVREVGVGIT